jgi:hypothetical protein
VLTYSACRTSGDQTNGKRSFHRENMPRQYKTQKTKVKVWETAISTIATEA